MKLYCARCKAAQVKREKSNIYESKAAQVKRPNQTSTKAVARLENDRRRSAPQPASVHLILIVFVCILLAC